MMKGNKEEATAFIEKAIAQLEKLKAEVAADLVVIIDADCADTVRLEKSDELVASDLSITIDYLAKEAQ